MTPCLERFAARPGFLDWNDADWGIRHGFLLPEDYAELRFRELDADGPDADDVVALRLADDNDERRDVIRRKASRTPEADERSGRKWAFATVEAIWLAHKDDPEALFREVHWFWEWELMDWGVDGALAPGLDRVLGFAPLTSPDSARGSNAGSPGGFADICGCATSAAGSFPNAVHGSASRSSFSGRFSRKASRWIRCSRSPAGSRRRTGCGSTMNPSTTLGAAASGSACRGGDGATPAARS